jgi:hypothetical protein
MYKRLLPALIFQPNCSLETLTIIPDKILVSIELGHIVPCPSLKRITLSLIGLRHLFILCECFFSLEHLRILTLEYDSMDMLDNIDQYVLGKSFSKHLRELQISGGINYANIELFIQQFASSLQYLTLRLSTGSEPINGQRLETGLINMCIKLKKFKFYFYFNSKEDISADIESFKYVNGVSVHEAIKQLQIFLFHKIGFLGCKVRVKQFFIRYKKVHNNRL